MSARRKFMKQMAMVGAGGYAFLKTGSLGSAIAYADAQRAAKWPAMTYRKLGNTGFNASRLVYGCGAALSRKPADRLLNLAFDQGVNVFDVGTSDYYGDAERNLSRFANDHRDEIFVISKGLIAMELDPNGEVTKEQATRAAKNWSDAMDKSLRDLKRDHVDAYYVMSSYNASLARNEEMRRAFERARDAGKVTHWGMSSHQNADQILQAAIDTEWYSLLMLAITPAGWYDWAKRDILDGTPDLKSLQPQLAKAREAGIGIVGMKAGRLLAGRGLGGRDNEQAFDTHYSKNLLASPLSNFGRSYAYVLANGVDVVNADLQSLDILEENYAAAAIGEDFIA